VLWSGNFYDDDENPAHAGFVFRSNFYIKSSSAAKALTKSRRAIMMRYHGRRRGCASKTICLPSVTQLAGCHAEISVLYRRAPRSLMTYASQSHRNLRQTSIIEGRSPGRLNARLPHMNCTLNWTSWPSYSLYLVLIGYSETRTVNARLVLNTCIPMRTFTVECVNSISVRTLYFIGYLASY